MLWPSTFECLKSKNDTLILLYLKWCLAPDLYQFQCPYQFLSLWPSDNGQNKGFVDICTAMNVKHDRKFKVRLEINMKWIGHDLDTNPSFHDNEKLSIIIRWSTEKTLCNKRKIEILEFLLNDKNLETYCQVNSFKDTEIIHFILDFAQFKSHYRTQTENAMIMALHQH